MKLESLDLSKCLFDPNKSSLLKDVEKYEEFNKDLTHRMSRKAVLTYIILMYDQASPLRREIRSLPARKGTALQVAGFKTDKNGRFEVHVEKILEGVNQDVNAMIVKYLLLQNSPSFMKLVLYELMLARESAKIINGVYKTPEAMKSIDGLTDSIDKLTEEVIGGRGEAEPILAAIYQEVTKNIDVSPETISEYIVESGDLPEEFNPYNVWREKDGRLMEEYKVDKIKYVGAE